MTLILVSNEKEWNFLQDILLEKKGFNWISTKKKRDPWLDMSPILEIDEVGMYLSKFSACTDRADEEELLIFIEGMQHVYELPDEEITKEDEEVVKNFRIYVGGGIVHPCKCTPKDIHIGTRGVVFTYKMYEEFVEEVEQYNDENLL